MGNYNWFKGEINLCLSISWTGCELLKILQVLDLAFLGPEVQDAREEIEDIFFLRYYKNRQYHIDKLYKELVPQLEFVDGELIRTHFLGYNRKIHPPDKIVLLTQYCSE